jgi:soluble lytic murein transglycosylase-like protein
MRLAGALALALHSVAAQAQVIEISEAGVVTRQDGPATYLGAGTSPRPIETREAARPSAAVPRSPLPSPMVRALVTSAAAHGVSADLVYVLAWHESRFRQEAVSAKGAIGVMQIMPATARSLGIDPYDLQANIEGGVILLSRLLRQYDGDLAKSLAAYDAGPGAVARYRGVPPYPETRAYVADIFEQLARLAIPTEFKKR